MSPDELLSVSSKSIRGKKVLDSELELLIYIILYVGLEAKEGRITSFSKPYHELKRAKVNVNYKRYEKVVEYAQRLGLLQISESFLDPRHASNILRGKRRGRFPSKFLIPTEKGLKLVDNLQALEDAGLDAVVRRVKGIKPIKDLLYQMYQKST